MPSAVNLHYPEILERDLEIIGFSTLIYLPEFTFVEPKLRTGTSVAVKTR